jgi:predicted DCC family thiol-disulfide oxidoreductase YuxK
MSGDSTEGPIILFDGVCNLCHGAVRFVIRRDPNASLRFAPLESGLARRLVRERAGHEPPADSILLVDEGELYQRSDAVLRIAARLRSPWPAIALLRAVPRPLRDAAYDYVARNRYRWFGRKQACPVPEPEMRDRFLG